VEVHTAIDPLVGPLLLLDGTRAHEAERPPLELVGIVLGELRRAGEVHGFADDLVRRLDLLAV
jgi:hypothetical protein